MSALHSKQTTAQGIHVIVAFEFADGTNRAAGTVANPAGHVLSAADIGKVGLQSDNSSYWILNGFGPLVWVQIGASAGVVPTARTLTAGAGLTGGGDLSADRTFDIVANVDGSIAVNADDIAVGVLASDVQHGSRGGASQHAVATGAVNGFMSSTDKTKLDGVAASAAALTAAAPADVTKAAAVVGVATAAARADHKHDVFIAVASTTAIEDSAAEGVATSLARSDHKHTITAGTPVDVGTANAAGAAVTHARSDHVHNLPFTPVQTALGAASDAVSFNNQDLTNVGDINGIHYFPVSATDPTSPTPVDGDRYYNSVLHEFMTYDGARSKFLSTAQVTLQSGATGNTIVGSYFRGADGLAYGTNIGHPVPKGTLVGFLFSMTTAVSAVIEVLIDTTVIASLSVSAAGVTVALALNADFSQGLMKFRNKLTGSNTVVNAQMTALIKRRV